MVCVGIMYLKHKYKQNYTRVGGSRDGMEVKFSVRELESVEFVDQCSL